MNNTLSNLKFIFRLQNQQCSLEKCWLGGYKHAQQGNPESLNPFNENTKESQFWLEGWWSGYYEEPQLFKDADTIKPTKTTSKPKLKVLERKTDKTLLTLGAIVGTCALVSAAIDLAA